MNTTLNILALSLIKGVGASFVKKNLPLIEQYAQSLDLLSMIGGKVNLQELEYNIPKAELILKDCKEKSIEVISIIDKNYPSLLRLISDPPAILYLKGNIQLLSKAIAIIGTRKSNKLGNDIAFRVGEYFSENWSICNGLVEGIDKHAISNEDKVFNSVIGVISGGLNYENTSSLVTRELCKKVLNGNGLLVSENEPNKKEDRFSGRCACCTATTRSGGEGGGGGRTCVWRGRVWRGGGGGGVRGIRQRSTSFTQTHTHTHILTLSRTRQARTLELRRNTEFKKMHDKMKTLYLKQARPYWERAVALGERSEWYAQYTHHALLNTAKSTGIDLA